MRHHSMSNTMKSPVIMKFTSLLGVKVKTSQPGAWAKEPER